MRTLLILASLLMVAVPKRPLPFKDKTLRLPYPQLKQQASSYKEYRFI